VDIMGRGFIDVEQYYALAQTNKLFIQSLTLLSKDGRVNDTSSRQAILLPFPLNI